MLHGLATSSTANAVQLDFFRLLDASLADAPVRQSAEVIPFPLNGVNQAIETAREETLRAEETRNIRNTRNFRISDHLDHFSGQKDKFAANLRAIKILKALQDESRSPSEEESSDLVRFTGWGGIPHVFNPEPDPSWQAEHAELRDLLQEHEWIEARASTTTAFFTPPMVIRWMWSMLERLGFKGGRILEPAGGIGHFIGCMPAHVTAQSVLTAVEPDSISAGIFKALYPDVRLHIMGLEKTALQSESFDVVCTNVPFGDFRVADPKFDRMRLKIHDYFLAKSISLVRPGGIVAAITSRYTMDKHSSGFRQYLHGLADLVAAVRLAGDTFTDIAGTSVVTDVLFLRKRIAGEAQGSSDWTETTWVKERSYDPGLYLNKHFAHGSNIAGILKTRPNGRYGEVEVRVESNGPLETHLERFLKEAPEGIYHPLGLENLDHLVESGSGLPAPNDVKDGGYVLQEERLFQRNGSNMEPVEGVPDKTRRRITDMLEIRDAVRSVLRLDLEGEDASWARTRLNRLYDAYVAEYGWLTDRANRLAFREDPDAPLLWSLEIRDDERETVSKAEVFRQSTVRLGEYTDQAHNLSEALALSLNRFGKLNTAAIRRWLGWSETQLRDALVEAECAYLDPATDEWEVKDAYLSGNVRTKLSAAEAVSATDPFFIRNVEALKSVLPRQLTAAEIKVRLGATWLPVEVVELFARHLLKGDVHIWHTPEIATWSVTPVWSVERGVENTTTWGSKRATACRLIDDALNQRLTTVYDEVELPDGRTTRVVNKMETVAAREKQHAIQEEFHKWLWADNVRRDRLVDRYNAVYRSMVPRRFDGGHLQLPGSNPGVELRLNQKDAIWRVLVSDYNTLLAHAVGAGKTWTMIAAGMEAKRLGICNKPLFIVPNHMLDQFQADFLRLYPTANVLAASKEDLTGYRRRTMLTRIATGNWDGIILTHSSFEKIPLSDKIIQEYLLAELERLEQAIRATKSSEDGNHRGGNQMVKLIESAKKRLIARMEGLLGRSRKDGAMPFEELGIDMLFVDEAHCYKNLWTFSKMRRVAGIQQSSSMRAFDLFLKTRVLMARRRDSRGIVFATATPIANAVGEMFTMQRYLQPGVLEEHGLGEFDAWAANFGQTVTSIELAPDGSGYRMHTRFARYVNLPELMTLYRLVADIRTKDMLGLPEPELEGGKPITVSVPASQELKDYVATLVKRAEEIRNGNVDPRVDNMLCVTNDGRKAALDMRLIMDDMPDALKSKVNAAVANIHREWEESRDIRATQIVFCDLSTPETKGFSVYHDVRDKLIERGVPAAEIAFVHDFGTDARKAELFRKVRAGSIRILFGSTQKLGMGTNVQNKLIAEHELDAPWRPADVEQRHGRILRQGNANPSVRIYRYVTEQSFDAYIWQTLETKARFIAQVMSGNDEVRSMEEVEMCALSYAEVKAIASGNPLVLEKAGVDAEVLRLVTLRKAHYSQLRQVNIDLSVNHDAQMRAVERIAGIERDIQNKEPVTPFQIEIGGKRYRDPKQATKALHIQAHRINSKRIGYGHTETVGSYRGLNIEMAFRFAQELPDIRLTGNIVYELPGGEAISTAIQRMDRLLVSLDDMLEATQEMLGRLQADQAKLEVESQRPFEHEARLIDRINRQVELEQLLGITENDDQALDTEEAAA